MIIKEIEWRNRKNQFRHSIFYINDNFTVPRYIKEAVLWACGGILYDHN